MTIEVKAKSGPSSPVTFPIYSMKNGEAIQIVISAVGVSNGGIYGSWPTATGNGSQYVSLSCTADIAALGSGATTPIFPSTAMTPLQYDIYSGGSGWTILPSVNGTDSNIYITLDSTANSSFVNWTISVDVLSAVND